MTYKERKIRICGKTAAEIREGERLGDTCRLARRQVVRTLPGTNVTAQTGPNVGPSALRASNWLEHLAGQGGDLETLSVGNSVAVHCFPDVTAARIGLRPSKKSCDQPAPGFRLMRDAVCRDFQTGGSSRPTAFNRA